MRDNLALFVAWRKANRRGDDHIYEHHVTHGLVEFVGTPEALRRALLCIDADFPVRPKRVGYSKRQAATLSFTMKTRRLIQGVISLRFWYRGDNHRAAIAEHKQLTAVLAQRAIGEAPEFRRFMDAAQAEFCRVSANGKALRAATKEAAKLADYSPISNDENKVWLEHRRQRRLSAATGSHDFPPPTPEQQRLLESPEFRDARDSKDAKELVQILRALPPRGRMVLMQCARSMTTQMQNPKPDRDDDREETED